MEALRVARRDATLYLGGASPLDRIILIRRKIHHSLFSIHHSFAWLTEYADTLEPKWTESEDLDRPGTAVVGSNECRVQVSEACFLPGSLFISVYGDSIP